MEKVQNVWIDEFKRFFSNTELEKTKVMNNLKRVKIFTENIEDTAHEQVVKIMHSLTFMDERIRIMPDVHSGKDAVIGFTSTFNRKKKKFLNPNLLGKDIGCGVITINLGKIKIDLFKLDMFIRDNIPLGFNVNKEINKKYAIKVEPYVRKVLENINKVEKLDYFLLSLGSLGGGNHFIELDKSVSEELWLTIHTGSRNFGHTIATHYANKLKNNTKDFNIEDYFYAVKVAQSYAMFNRYAIIDKIIGYLNLDINKLKVIESIHNYYDFGRDIIRKGAISANKDEHIVIPLNMKDGVIIGKGKGNIDWNYSAPHGAGRILSRRQAKKQLDLNKFKKEMKNANIFSTSINEHTLDEAPEAYKSAKEIIENIKDTVEITEILKPVYNLKAD